jgi:N-acetylated-alpha-linked acidic dipeptidase
MSENGYSSVPPSEHEQPPKLSTVDRFRRWWSSQWNSSETAPLINRQRMTLEPPRASALSVTFKIVAIVAAFVITAAVIVFSFTDSPTGGKQTRVTSSL